MVPVLLDVPLLEGVREPDTVRDSERVGDAVPDSVGEPDSDLDCVFDAEKDLDCETEAVIVLDCDREGDTGDSVRDGLSLGVLADEATGEDVAGSGDGLAVTTGASLAVAVPDGCAAVQSENSSSTSAVHNSAA